MIKKILGKIREFFLKSSRKEKALVEERVEKYDKWTKDEKVKNNLDKNEKSNRLANRRP